MIDTTTDTSIPKAADIANADVAAPRAIKPKAAKAKRFTKKSRKKKKTKSGTRGPGPYKPKAEAKPAAKTKTKASTKSKPKAETSGNGKAPASPTIKPPAPDVALPSFCYQKDNGCYWRETTTGEFVRVKEEDLKRHLRFAGVRVMDYDGAPGLTKFDSAIVRCQNESSVDSVIALAGHGTGIYKTDDGRRILIPRTPSRVTPEIGPIPNWENLLDELFGSAQLPYGLSWLKCAVEDRYSQDPARWRHHQLLALVGKPDCGKSFLQMLITLLLGGRDADSYLWMAGKTDFNEDLAEAEHWKMEDKNAFRDSKSRSSFGGIIKQACVSHSLSVHGKGKKQILLPTFRRLTLSINEDPEYIIVLPMLDSSVADKIMILKCGKATMLPDWKANRARFVAELPAFVAYLMKVFRIPPELEHGRYGVKHYHAPEVVKLLEQHEPHFRLLEVIDAVLFGGPGPHSAWTSTSTDLQQKLCEGAYATIGRQLITNASACGQLLSKIQKAMPDRVDWKEPNGTRKWTIQPPR